MTTTDMLAVTTADLPAVNASLNTLATILLTLGYVFVKKKQLARHKACMIAATTVSAIFLICYLTYHYNHGSTKFTHPGPIRYVYFFILITHVILAATVAPLVPITLYRAWKQQFDRHRRIARWTWPIWMYVSITGVIVYLMLYQLFPGPS